jgi:hypothetical protein
MVAEFDPQTGQLDHLLGRRDLEPLALRGLFQCGDDFGQVLIIQVARQLVDDPGGYRQIPNGLESGDKPSRSHVVHSRLVRPLELFPHPIHP